MSFFNKIPFFNKIKEKLLLIFNFKKEGENYGPESLALKLTFLIFVIIIIFIVIIIKIFLPQPRLEIKISAPEAINAGEIISYTVTCKNTGNVILEKPELVFNFSNQSLSEKEELVEVVKSEEFNNFFYPKEEKTFTFTARLFGNNQIEEAKAWLYYDTKYTSSRQMSQISAFATKVLEIPLNVELNIPSKIPVVPKKENEFKFKIRYFASFDYPLSNLKMEFNYPANFVFEKSEPEVIEENQLNISTLEKNKAYEIEFQGKFNKEQKLEEKIFFGAQLFTVIRGEKILLKKIDKDALTYKPYFSVSQKINNADDYIASPGEILHYQINFENISEEPLKDLTLISLLKGSLYDLSTIKCLTGRNQQGDNSIVWDKENISKLRYLSPGEEMEVEFWVNLRPDYVPEDKSEVNAMVKNVISLGEFEKEFSTKVNSKIEISQEGYYEDKYGYFKNSGNPPRVNKISTYSIVWSIKNYYNLLKDIEIKASLPPQVKVISTKSSQGNVAIKDDYTEKESPYPGIPGNFTFENNLSYKMNNYEVKYLQIILKDEVPYIYPKYVPPTGYFGQITLNSLMEFQKKYKKEILDPQNSEKPTGYVDSFTRLKLNELLTKGIPIGASEIIWQIDTLEPYTGISSEPLIVAFQISFTPTLAQKGKTAQLINAVLASGKDQWTQEIITASDEGIDTSLPDDMTIGDGLVE